MNHSVLEALAAAADDPAGWAARWKARTGGRVIGFLPMNFPAELVDAVGALPYQLQESHRGITLGNSVFPTFYCGYTRSLVDQAMRGELDVLDALCFVDNCVQLIGAADVVRAKLDGLRTRYFQLDPSMKAESSSHDTATRVFAQLQAEVETITGRSVSDDSLAASVQRFNEGRAMLREIHAMRRHGQALTASQMQVLVKAGMVMERSEYNAHLREVLEALRREAPPPRTEAVRVHLSGHMCQAPKPQLLDLLEDCGARVVNDDLYHGHRYFATDVPALHAGPGAALVDWYFARNNATPCPTRTHTATRWSRYLPDAAREAGAEGVITLLAKFCEPHMYLVPELSGSLETSGVPHLLIETEHEGMPLEAIRTRVESFVESIRSRRSQAPARQFATPQETA